MDEIIVSVIIVNYNASKYLENCLDSLIKAVSNVKSEIIVVDNHSTDGSVLIIKKKYPMVRLIENFENRGFGAANNQGFFTSSGKYILLLNNDTVVSETAVESLISLMEKHFEDIAVAGPHIKNPDGSTQFSCMRRFPKLFNSVFEFSGISSLFPKSKFFSGYNLTYLDPKKTNEVDCISGACLIYRRGCLEDEAVNGLFDENFFFHFEDIDLCFRVKKQGFKIMACGAAEILHFKGQSSKSRQNEVKEEFIKSAFYYYKKNYKPENFLGYILISSGLKLLYFFKKKR